MIETCVIDEFSKIIEREATCLEMYKLRPFQSIQSVIKCSSRLTLQVKALDDDSAKYLIQALGFDPCPCPAESTLDLSHRNLGHEDARLLAKALNSRRCPPGLILNLNGNKLSHYGVEYLAKALSFGNCPARLTLKLCSTEISEYSADYIIRALISRRCPMGLTVDLRGNDVVNSNYIIRKLSHHRGFLPLGLTLNLDVEKDNYDCHCYFGHTCDFHFDNMTDIRIKLLCQATLVRISLVCLILLQQAPRQNTKIKKIDLGILKMIFSFILPSDPSLLKQLYPISFLKNKFQTSGDILVNKTFSVFQNVQKDLKNKNVKKVSCAIS